MNKKAKKQDSPHNINHIGSDKVMSCFKKFFSAFSPRKKHSQKFEEDPFDKAINEIKEAALSMSEDEKFIFNNFLKFGSKTVSKVMIPRSDIFAVAITASKDEISSKLQENMHTRTLIYEDTLDNIVGFVHIKDLFFTVSQNKEFNLKKLVRRPIIAAPSMKLIDLLAEMQKRKTHIAVILDEYGGTDGIVTIEDVIEELVGKIEDEHDAEEKSVDYFKVINPKTVLCNSRVRVEELEAALKIKFKKQDDYFETVGGLVLARAGYFPKAGTTIMIEDNVFAEILESSPKTIKTLKLMVK